MHGLAMNSEQYEKFIAELSSKYKPDSKEVLFLNELADFCRSFSDYHKIRSAEFYSRLSTLVKTHFNATFEFKASFLPAQNLFDALCATLKRLSTYSDGTALSYSPLITPDFSTLLEALDGSNSRYSKSKMGTFLHALQYQQGEFLKSYELARLPGGAIVRGVLITNIFPKATTTGASTITDETPDPSIDSSLFDTGATGVELGCAYGVASAFSNPSPASPHLSDLKVEDTEFVPTTVVALNPAVSSSPIVVACLAEAALAPFNYEAGVPTTASLPLIVCNGEINTMMTDVNNGVSEKFSLEGHVYSESTKDFIDSCFASASTPRSISPGLPWFSAVLTGADSLPRPSPVRSVAPDIARSASTLSFTDRSSVVSSGAFSFGADTHSPSTLPHALASYDPSKRPSRAIMNLVWTDPLRILPMLQAAAHPLPQPPHLALLYGTSVSAASGAKRLRSDRMTGVEAPHDDRRVRARFEA